MTPELEAATALLQVWDGNLEELAWAARLFEAIERKANADVHALIDAAALAREVCHKARMAGDADEIAQLERAIARVS